jgi:hypothetical protein
MAEVNKFMAENVVVHMEHKITSLPAAGGGTALLLSVLVGYQETVAAATSDISKALDTAAPEASPA